jgi:hypothetical protein
MKPGFEHKRNSTCPNPSPFPFIEGILKLKEKIEKEGLRIRGD